MKYTLKKNLFTTRLLNENGKKLNLKNSPFKLKTESGNFSLISKDNTSSPKLNAIHQIKGNTYGVTKNYEQCKINLTTGKVSKTYLRQLGDYYILSNGRIVKFNKELSVVPTKLSAIITNGKIKYPNNIYNKVIIKNQDDNFGVIDENGKVICPCIFDSENIWFNFKTERKTPPDIPHQLCLQKIESLSAYSSEGTTKLFNETHKVVYETSKTQSVLKLKDLKNSVTLSVYDAEYNVSRIYNYHFATQKLTGSAFINGFVVKYEKIEGEAFYGAIRNEQNKLVLVDFRGKPITTEQFETIEFAKLNNKTVAIVSKNNNYGIFDIRNRSYIIEPDLTYNDAMNHVKNANKETIK